MNNSYVYLIGWSQYNKFYYGVRYAKNCTVDDLWVSYFTSSPNVHEFRQKFGEPDIVQIRKTFNSIEKARLWEHKVLRRMHCKTDDRFFNQNEAPSPPRMIGNENPSKRPDVRVKLSLAAKNRGGLSDESISKMKLTKTKTNIIKFVRKRNFKPTKTQYLIERIRKYIDVVENEYTKKHDRILNILNDRLNSCLTYKPKPYPKNRKSGPRGPIPKIGEYRRNKNWYYDPITDVNRLLGKKDDKTGLIRGMKKNTPNNMTPVARQKLSESMKHARSMESEEKRNIRLKKYYETIEKRKNRVES